MNLKTKLNPNSMKYIKINYLVPIVALLILNSCSSLSVTTDSDKTVDFTKFKTFSYYGWADNSDKILNQFSTSLLLFELIFRYVFSVLNIFSNISLVSDDHLSSTSERSFSKG